MAMQIERGSFGSVSLDGIPFVMLAYTPEEMGKGNWSVGLIIDERASAEQRDAITAIASGQAGGPMAPLSGLIGKFLGVDSAAIRIDRSGLKFTVKAGDLLDMAAEGQRGIDPNTTDPMFLDNTGHPVSTRLALAHASKSHLHALGLAWDDNSAGLGSLIAISEGAEATQPFRPEMKAVDAYATAILDEINFL